MATLSRFGLVLSKSIHTGRPLLVDLSTKRCAYWNKDWMPGDYPKTPGERAAAAKKYGLRPDDYEPYPEEEGYGDYPKLPDIGDASKSYYNNYEYPEYKRNYGEPLHIDFDIFTEDRYNPSATYGSYTLQSMGILWILFLATMAGIYYIAEDYQVYQPTMAKQMLKDDTVHYTFEPVE